MDHPDWPSFVSSILSNPDDDTARLVAADFLEECGDPDRATFIRVQVELARLEANGEGKSLETDELRKKERAFLGPLSMFPSFWAAEECPELVRVCFRERNGGSPLGDVQVTGTGRLTWRRGFIEAVSCDAATWVRHGLAVRKRQPIRHVTLEVCDDLTRDDWYRAFPSLTQLHSVTLRTARVPVILSWVAGHLRGTKVTTQPT